MNSANSNPNSSSGLYSGFVSALLLGSFFLAFWPVWQNLLHAWSTSDDYSHGFFIVPIAIFIVWRGKKSLAALPKSSSWLTFPVLLFVIMAYLFAYLAGIATVMAYSMVALLAVTVWFFWGKAMVKALSFPIFLLLFMIPVPAQIYATLTVPLQLFVSQTSVGLASFLGVPIFREGNIIHLPEQTLQVVQACSGMRSLISLLGLSVLFAYFALKSNQLRAILFISGVPIAIGVNIVRVFIMILGFYFFDFDLTQGVIHEILGGAIFVLALILIAITKGVLSHWDISTEVK